MSEPLGVAFRLRLKAAIRADPRTHAEIAKASGYSAPHIRHVISGHRPNPTLAFVETMAVTLDRDVAWMLGLQGDL